MSANPSTSGGGGGPGAASAGGLSGGGGGGPCGACKFLRRKCVPGCIFAPYFDSEQGAAHFAAVHKVFGASNVSKLLLHIPIHKRLDAVVTICYEAQARLRDPVYGCVAHIFALQQQLLRKWSVYCLKVELLIRDKSHFLRFPNIQLPVVSLQAELSYLQAHLATLELPSPSNPPPPPPPTSFTAQPPLSISDLPSASSLPATYDLSSLFDPMAQPAWAMQQQRLDHRQFAGGGSSMAAGEGDLQALARELLHRHGAPPCSDASSPQSLSK